MELFSKEEKRRNREDDLQRLRDFRLMDDTFMRAVLKNNLPLAQGILRTVTGLHDLVLTSEKTQEDMVRVTGARSICLDVYGSDSLGRKYDLEVQKASSGAGPNRADYHASVLNIENLRANQDFDELPETFVIFITEHDVFGEGEAVNSFHWRNDRTGKLLGARSNILYINGDYTGDDDIGRLMHDFKCKNPEEMYDRDLAERVYYYKHTEKGVEEMCQIMEDLREETAKRANAKTLVAAVEHVAGKLNGSIEAACDMVGCSVEEYQDAKELIKKSA